jgi:hypothetical protein
LNRANNEQRYIPEIPYQISDSEVRGYKSSSRSRKLVGGPKYTVISVCCLKSNFICLLTGLTFEALWCGQILYCVYRCVISREVYKKSLDVGYGH